MRLLLKTGAIALALGLGGCAGLLGGGGKPPTTLVTLTPQAADPGQIARTAVAGQAVTIATPSTARELSSVRVPVQLTPSDVQYVTNLQLADTPARLFANLLAETVRRTTNRVVLDNGQTTLDPGLIVSGQLQRFGYDASTGQVVVTFDGALSTAAGNRVETRRFTASVPADGTGPSVGPALNQAANQVAQDVAKWIGSGGS
ncbi:MAG: membrane integrity-associated transporter subunit PqiC [Sphingomonas sp.]|nr:membrane integrity-associated transporter subunit PqiC [Sphingomonas sp.]